MKEVVNYSLLIISIVGSSSLLAAGYILFRSIGLGFSWVNGKIGSRKDIEKLVPYPILGEITYSKEVSQNNVVTE